MILIIKTASEEKVFIALAQNGKLLAKKEFRAKYQQAEKLLPEIDKLLEKQVCHLVDLRGIAIVSGPGPFTALRLGIATANSLAWVLNIPVAGIRLTDFKNIEELVKIGERKIRTARVGDIVEPFYGKKPNITWKK